MTVNSVKRTASKDSHGYLAKLNLFVCKYYVSCKTAVLKQKPVAVACASLREEPHGFTGRLTVLDKTG